MKNHKKYCYFLILCLFVLFQKTQAQDENAAFDNKKTIYKLTPDIEKQIKLFTGEGTFIDAELFKQNDSCFALEIHYSKDSKVYRDKRLLTLAEVSAIRTKIDAFTHTQLQSLDSTEGRVFLLTTSSLSGLAIYGPSAIYIANSNNMRINIGVYMLGAGGLFFVPYFATKNIPVSFGQANMVYYGLTRGYLQGALMALAFSQNITNKSQIVSVTGSLTGITEAILGFHLVKNLNISNGNADLITVCGDYGFYLGLGTAIQCNTIKNNQEKATMALTAGGSVASEVAGYYIGKQFPVTTGSAEIMYSTALLGEFLPLSIVNMINPKQASSYTTPSVLLGAAGMYVGYTLTRDQNFTFTQGFITRLGTITGGFIGLGLTYLCVKNAKSWEYLAGSYIGAQASFCLLYFTDKKLNDLHFKNVGFTFMPQNYFFGLEMSKHNPLLQGMVPLAQLHYTF